MNNGFLTGKFKTMEKSKDMSLPFFVNIFFKKKRVLLISKKNL